MTPAFFVGTVGALASIFTFIVGYGLGRVHSKERLEEVKKTFKDIDNAVKASKTMRKVLAEMIKKIDGEGKDSKTVREMFEKATKEIDEKNKHKT